MHARLIAAAALLGACQPAQLVGTFVPDTYMPTRHARVIFVGDGVTDGVGATKASTRYPALLVANDDDLFPAATEQDLVSWTGMRPQVHDVALAGADSNAVVDIQLAALEGQATGPGRTAIFATLGAPDLALAFADPTTTVGAAIDALERNVEALADWAADPTRFPDGADLFLSTMIDVSDGGTTTACLPAIAHGRYADVLDDIHQRYRTLAEERSFVLVDALGHFRGHGRGQVGDGEWVTEQCAYPNDRGHHELRRLFFQVVAEGTPLAGGEPTFTGF